MAGKDPFRSLDPETRARRLNRQREQLAYVTDWLRHRGLTQKHIANTLGVTDSVVSRYISGETMMPAGALREIALLLEIGEGELVRPPPGDQLGPIMEDTIREMERLGRDQWLKLLELAKGMRGRAE
ncbi:MAG: helix-turn-helix transcriptional regulator [Burkholderiales bacterium]|nr:helix-turn-helix transcriptional regulator [Burkholderiales bacterium]